MKKSYRLQATSRMFEQVARQILDLSMEQNAPNSKSLQEGTFSENLMDRHLPTAHPIRRIAEDTGSF